LPGGRRGPNLRSQKNIARCRSQSGYATLFDIEVLLVEPTIRGIKKHTAKNEPILVCRTRDDSFVLHDYIEVFRSPTKESVFFQGFSSNPTNFTSLYSSLVFFLIEFPRYSYFCLIFCQPTVLLEAWLVRSCGGLV